MSRGYVVLVIGCLVAGSTQARAQKAASAAEMEFDRGRQLLAAGKFAEACDAFEKSAKIDPQIGTLYNIGRCEEGQGKTASAWEAYREVAQKDTNEGRRKDAAARAAALAPKLTKLLVNSAASPAGFAVRVNGNDVTNLLGIETPVDPGEYAVVAGAQGYTDWSATVSAIGAGLTVTVAIPPLERAQPVAPGTAPRSEPGKETTSIAHLQSSVAATPGGSSRKTLALGIGAGGGALVIGSAVFAVLARGKWDDAKAVCGGALTCPDDAHTVQANALGDAARTRANVATGLLGAGVVAVGIGAALYFSSHDESPHGVAIVPSAGPSGASVTIEGRF